MRQIDIILITMKNDISKKAYKKLENVLESVLLPSHESKDNTYILNAYIEHCKFENFSDGTIHVYKAEITNLANSCDIPLIDMTHQEIKRYLQNCAKTCKAKTVAHKRAMINAFFDYLLFEEWININPCARVPKIKVAQEQKIGISDVEIAQVMKYVENDRDAAIIEFMKATGCRVSEVSKLNYGDVDLVNRTAFIRQAKGKKDRTVSFDKHCEKALRKYLKQLRNLTADTPVFLRRASSGAGTMGGDYVNKRLKISSIQQIVYDLKKASGVENFHCHALRHYCITKLLSNKMPLKLVSLQAGHSSTSTTLDIYDNVTLQEMQSEYHKAMN